MGTYSQQHLAVNLAMCYPHLFKYEFDKWPILTYIVHLNLNSFHLLQIAPYEISSLWLWKCWFHSFYLHDRSCVRVTLRGNLKHLITWSAVYSLLPTAIEYTAAETFTTIFPLQLPHREQAAWLGVAEVSVFTFNSPEIGKVTASSAGITCSL